jgi:hypothetical protein
MITEVRRKNLATMLKLNASTANQWPMSEAEALKKALAKVKRQEAKGMWYDTDDCFINHVNATISSIVNDKKYW